MVWSFTFLPKWVPTTLVRSQWFLILVKTKPYFQGVKTWLSIVGGSVTINMWSGVNSLDRPMASWNIPGIKLQSRSSDIYLPVSFAFVCWKCNVTWIVCFEMCELLRLRGLCYRSGHPHLPQAICNYRHVLSFTCRLLQMHHRVVNNYSNKIHFPRPPQNNNVWPHHLEGALCSQAPTWWTDGCLARPMPSLSSLIGQWSVSATNPM